MLARRLVWALISEVTFPLFLLLPVVLIAEHDHDYSLRSFCHLDSWRVCSPSTSLGVSDLRFWGCFLLELIHVLHYWVALLPLQLGGDEWSHLLLYPCRYNIVPHYLVPGKQL